MPLVRRRNRPQKEEDHCGGESEPYGDDNVHKNLIVRIHGM